MRPAPGESPGPFAEKYGSREADAAVANARVIALLGNLAARLKEQKKNGENVKNSL